MPKVSSGQKDVGYFFVEGYNSGKRECFFKKNTGKFMQGSLFFSPFLICHGMADHLYMGNTIFLVTI